MRVSGGRLTEPSAPSPADLELTLLRALCNRPTNDPREWARVAKELADHPWQQPDHRVVFEALRRIGTWDPQTLAQQLPSEATRMGFPDISWDQYFTPSQVPIAPAYVEDLIRTLKQKWRQE